MLLTKTHVGAMALSEEANFWKRIYRWQRWYGQTREVPVELLKLWSVLHV